MSNKMLSTLAKEAANKRKQKEQENVENVEAKRKQEREELLANKVNTILDEFRNAYSKNSDKWLEVITENQSKKYKIIQMKYNTRQAGSHSHRRGQGYAVCEYEATESWYSAEETNLFVGLEQFIVSLHPYLLQDQDRKTSCRFRNCTSYFFRAKITFTDVETIGALNKRLNEEFGWHLELDDGGQGLFLVP